MHHVVDLSSVGQGALVYQGDLPGEKVQLFLQRADDRDDDLLVHLIQFFRGVSLVKSIDELL